MLISCFPGGSKATEKITLEIPSQSGSLTYNGSSQSPAWNDYDPELMTIGGTTSATAAGSYTATFTLNDPDQYQWTDGTSGTQVVLWTIAEAQKTSVTVPNQSRTLTYNGSSQSPNWANYDSSIMILSGTTSATDAGTYNATFTLSDTGLYQWEDGTNAAKSVPWTIAKVSLTVPSQSGSLVETGSSQSPNWNDYDSSVMTIGGTTSGTGAGNYTATFALRNTTNYEWTDGTTETKSVTWRILSQRQSIAIDCGGEQIQTGDHMTIDIGEEKDFDISLYGDGVPYIVSVERTDESGTQVDEGIVDVFMKDETTMTVFGIENGFAEITVGASSSTFTYTSVYFEVQVNGSGYAIPTQRTSLTYNGEVQSPTWNGYDSSVMTISGTTSATDAGTYSVVFSLKNASDKWHDGTSEDKTVRWTISRVSVPVPTVTGWSYNSQYGYYAQWDGDQYQLPVEYDSSLCTMTGGTTLEKDPGTYNVTFELNDKSGNSAWSNGSTGTYTIVWSIVQY